MKIDLSRFRETFFQEADEHLGTLESGLLRLEGSGEADPELLNEIFRSAHSIKGASGTLNFEDIARFTHSLESLLDRLRAGEIRVCRELVDLLLKASDVLKGLLAAAREGAPPPAETEAVLEALFRAQRAPDPTPELRSRVRSGDRKPAAAVYRLRFRPAAEIFRFGMDPLLTLRDLARAGAITDLEADVSQLPPLAELDPMTCYLGWSLRVKTDQSIEQLREVFAFVEDGAELSIEPEAEASAAERQAPASPAAAGAGRAAPHESSSIRVPTQKVDKLVDLIGELVIAQSMVTEILDNFTPASLVRLREAGAEVQRYTRELQERVMSIRMLPVGSIFSRFPRLVRDSSAALGKSIALELIGEDTELDKGVVERMADPLTHLIRNAVDHGIESPAERRQAGKAEQGVIRLQAYHQGGNVFIEVADDGRGLDTARIRRKALERGLIGETDELTPGQVQALIFQPGFSTAETVSDLSGRGVGMDVVKRSVEALSGAVDVSSSPGRGCTFRVKLPLTLAILDGLTVRVGDQTYILPLVSITESIRPRREQVPTVVGRGEVVVVRGEPCPLLRLHALFGVETEVTDPTSGAVVIVEHLGRRVGLLVDELLGQQQVVIKSLETHFRKVEGVLGATILGDGRAALILDAAGLAQLAAGRAGEPDALNLSARS